jgi:ABC-type polysaccharide/polyol phosphate transport system ATPase subunit
LLGFTRKEAQDLQEDIIEFSGVREFIDAPLRTYSTGMVARLGFAVATSKRPEILLVDEVLSVGDGPFQEKCLERMNSFRTQGTTIIIVTHAMSTIQSFCQRALWLDHGIIQAQGAAGEVVEHYTHFQ